MSSFLPLAVTDVVAYIDSIPRAVVWSWFVRCVSLMAAWASVILGWQTKAIPALSGIMPIKPRFDRIKQDFPAPWRYLYYPSWLHICHVDWILPTLLYASTIVGSALVWSGTWSRLGLFIQWSTYLSYANISNFMYPWDCLLLETTFLTMFLPNLEFGWLGALECAPRPLVLFSIRYLVWRLMFGFGKMKFQGAKYDDLSYLKGFLICQPLPTVLGWLLHQLPMSVHVTSYVFLFLAEIPGPFLYFFTGWPRFLGFILVNMLQVGINLTGTFGFFNVLTSALSIGLLDLNSSLTDDFAWAGFTTDASSMLVNGWLCFLLLVHCVYFPFNNWCGMAFLYWPPLSIPATWVGKLLRFLQPFHMSHAYGVFFPHSSPHLKWIPLIEGTSDEVVDETASPAEIVAAKAAGAVPESQASWSTYSYRFIVSDPYLTPRFVAPYHPRMEHAILYEALGLGPQTHLAPLTTGDPYEFQPKHMLELVAAGLMRENEQVEDLFRVAPFGRRSKGGKRVRALRVSMYLFHPTSISTLLKTGRWYDRYYSHEHVPMMTLASMESPSRRQGLLKLKEPELFHPEMLLWQYRAPAIQRLLAKVEGPQGALVGVERKGLTSLLAAHTTEELASLVATAQPADTAVFGFSSCPVPESAITAFWAELITPLQSALAKVRLPCPAPPVQTLQNGSRTVGLTDAVLSEPKNRPFLVDKPWNVEEPGHWSRIVTETHAKMWRTLDQQTRDRHEKVCARLTLLLLARLLPLYHGPGADEPARTVWTDMHGTTPVSSRIACTTTSHLHLPSFYHLYVFCHHLINQGEAVYTQVLNAPERVADHLATYCVESCLFLFGLFHFDILAYQSRKRRLIACFSHPSAMVSGGVTPGFLGLYYHFLHNQFVTSREIYPVLHPPQSAFAAWGVDLHGMSTMSPGSQKEDESKKMC